MLNLESRLVQNQILKNNIVDKYFLRLIGRNPSETLEISYALVHIFFRSFINKI